MVEVKCYFSTLMKYARALGEAEKTDNPEAIKLAKQKHDDYAELCIKHGMILSPSQMST